MIHGIWYQVAKKRIQNFSCLIRIIVKFLTQNLVKEANIISWLISILQLN